MNVYNIQPCHKKLIDIPTVAFFPRYHPNLDLLVRRFADAYYNLFIVRYLDRNKLPPAEFYRGWNIVIVGKILDKDAQQELNELVYVPPMFVFFKDWENPTFQKIRSPWEPAMAPEVKRAPILEPISIVVPEPDVVIAPPVPKAAPKPKKVARPVNANEKKEVVSAPLRNSNNLNNLEDEDLLQVLRNCKELYPHPRVKQNLLVKHVLKEVFKQTHLRDPDIDFVNKHIVSRMVKIKGVKYSLTGCGFDLAK